MPNIKSAKKRVKTIARKTKENKFKKVTLATSIKSFKALIAAKEIEKAEAALPKLISLIDSTASHGVIHKKNADRKKARVNLMLNKAKKA